MWETQTQVVNGQQVAYLQRGKGAPLILLHGFPTSSYLFHGMVPILAEYFTVYALDLLGYGDSVVSPTTPIHLEAQADMVIAFARKLGLSPFTLIGHDLGGGIAQIIGLNHPEVLHRMVWINTVMDDNFPIARILALNYALYLPGVLALLKHSPILKIWAKSNAGIKDGVVDKSVVDQTALTHFMYDPFLNTPEGVERFGQAVRAQIENGQITRKIAPSLGEITTPTLLLWGQDDPFFSQKWPQRLVEEVPGIQSFHNIPDTGHFCPLEKPSLIADHIIQFLSQS